VRGPLFVVAAVIRNSKGQILLARRPRHQPIAGGLLEFPGGKVESGENPKSALVREIKEELGISIEIARTRGRDGLLGISSYVYDEHGLHIVLAAYHADVSPSEERKIQLSGIEEVKWVFPGQLPEAREFAPADIDFLPFVFESDRI
jgi:mutator protein MutT